MTLALEGVLCGCRDNLVRRLKLTLALEGVLCGCRDNAASIRSQAIGDNVHDHLLVCKIRHKQGSDTAT